jgi:hypothetical protein
MNVFAQTILVALFANAVISFFIAFFWQAKVIFTLFGVADWNGAYVPWKALANQNSPQNKLGRFIAGEIFPELRRKWLRAVTYVAISYAALFAVAGFVHVIAPEIV